MKRLISVSLLLASSFALSASELPDNDLVTLVYSKPVSTQDKEVKSSYKQSAEQLKSSRRAVTSHHQFNTIKVHKDDVEFEIERLKSLGFKVSKEHVSRAQGQSVPRASLFSPNINGLMTSLTEGEVTVNDPYYHDQTHLHSYSESNLVGSNIAESWELGEPKVRPRIAVIDGGFMTEGYFEDMTPPVANRSFVFERYGLSAWNEEDDLSSENGHGAAVYGVIAAKMNNGKGISGIVDADMVMVQSGLKGYYSSLVESQGILWAAGHDVHGIKGLETPVDVINISTGGEYECPYYYQEAVDAALAKGIAVITSAGNRENDIENMSPSNCKGVISVSNLYDYTGDLHETSSYGKGVSVSAKGTFVPSFHKTADDQIGDWTGTSFAAPIVSGIYGLAKSHAPSLSAKELRQISESTARKLTGSECKTYGCGAGLIDAEAFVLAAQSIQENGFGSLGSALNSTTPCDVELYKTATGAMARLCASYELNITPFFDNGKTTFRVMSAPIELEPSPGNWELITDTSETSLILTDINTQDNQYFFFMCDENGECDEGELYHLNTSTQPQPDYCTENT